MRYCLTYQIADSIKKNDNMQNKYEYGEIGMIIKA